MKNLFTITYTVTPYDQRKSYPQNANKNVKFKTFTDLAEAKAFAETVEAKHIVDNTGKKVIVF